MKEIKFKYVVKRQNGHVFSETFTMKQIELGEALLFLKINHAREMDVFKYQYTGLKDKNGKEIYEGDILKTECDEIRYISKNKDTKYFKSAGNVICKWEGYGFYFQHTQKNQHGVNLTTIEITGNIHDEVYLNERN